MSESRTRQGSPGRQVTISQELHGQRIDNFLLAKLKGVPRSHVYRILRTGQVRVNSGRIRAAYRLQTGDLVRIPPLRLAERGAPARPPDRVLEQIGDAILYEDRQILVLNKPPGIAVHGGSGLSFGVIEALRVLYPNDPSLELVHRLDRETSGCLLLTRRRSALRRLHEQFRESDIEKRYLALVCGRWNLDDQDVRLPLLKSTGRGGERVVTVNEQGKPARSRFRPVLAGEQASIVEVALETGRTHQIRVHAAALGFPVVGDARYGARDCNARWRSPGRERLFLHARTLGFRHPGTGDWQRIHAPLESHWMELLDRIFPA